MMSRSNLIIALIALSIGNSALAQLLVSDWSLTTAVQDLSLGGGQDVAFSFTVTNPFDVVQGAQLGPGTATTSYDFSWSGDNALFRIDAAHVDPDLGSFFYASFSQGSIRFTTTVPLVAHFTGAYNYTLPMPAAEVSTNFYIFDFQSSTHLINQVGLDDTILHPAPLSGSFAWDRTAIVPAGHTCEISYVMELVTRQNSGLLATGSGYFQLTLEPIPEPATLTLTSIAIALCIRSSRSRTNKTTPAQASRPSRHSPRAYD